MRGRDTPMFEEKHGSDASLTPPGGDLAHNPGMCPDWDSNRQLFDSQAGTQSIEPHQPGHDSNILKNQNEQTKVKDPKRIRDIIWR